MTSFPPSQPPGGQRPPPPPLPPYPPPSEGRSVSFFIAIFLGLLLLVSVGLNVVLLLFNIVGSAADSLTSVAEEDSAFYQIVAVGGDSDAPKRALRIPVEGAIAEQQSLLIGAAGGTVSQVRRALRVAGRDPTIACILLEVNSPGGGVTDSDEIYRVIREFRATTGKPIVALFGDMAASGGYYIAAACDYIMARRTTVTGSIGVIMSSYNVAGAAETLGIEELVIKSDSTPYKDILSPMRAMTEDERQILQGIVEEYYQQFVDIVDEGRPDLTREQVVKLANGSIYTGQQAMASGLIDQIGDTDDALEWLARRVGEESLKMVEHRRRPTLRDMLFGVRGPTGTPMERIAERLLHSTTGPRFLYYWQGGR